ncbi:MAG: phosphotransferase [Cyclobacteriaceae bacterium]
MNELAHRVLKLTGASKIIQTEHVQTLWSGYGAIKRFVLEGSHQRNVIVKHIQLPSETQHPRGWNTEISHLRKLKSYQVENHWYQHYSSRTNEQCKVPELYYSLEQGTELLLVLEDMDDSGFARRLSPENVTIEEVKNCLSWLAHFHGQFMDTNPEGLWEIGTYWHLDTRPDELENMQNQELKQIAKAVDTKLNQAKYQTLVHGDAKLANFCFGESADVAAVDFQYVGKGCGIKDVAYLISSCFDERECERYEGELLVFYFDQLEISIDKHIDFQDIKKEWSDLYSYAWTDFYRFLDGWSPGHWKMHAYSKRLVREVINEIEK